MISRALKQLTLKLIGILIILVLIYAAANALWQWLCGHPAVFIFVVLILFATAYFRFSSHVQKYEKGRGAEKTSLKKRMEKE